MSIIGRKPLPSPLIRLSALTLVTLAATMLAACSVAPGRDDARITNPPPDTTAPSIAGQQGTLDEFILRIWGPLGGPLGSLESPDLLEAAQAQSDQQWRAREEYVAACMAEQGFSYVPFTGLAPRLELAEGPLRGTREFAERNGFGLVASVGRGPTFFFGNAGTNPNQELLAVMSSAERAAWELALNGLPNPTGEERDPELDGCGWRADEATRPTANDEFAALHAEILRFRQHLPVHPALLNLNSEWAACLADQGYPDFRNPSALEDTLRSEWWIIQGWSQDLNQILLDWDWDGLPDGPPGWTVDEDGVGQIVLEPGARAAFTDRELALALADVDCREMLDFDARALVINHQLQQEFVAANRNELEAWADFAENQRAGRL